ncbi:hypothetical protein RclHR1_04180012 [Rhizophagus clarus]|uniref:Uncharacterized protein n=1 Tax=Rhizophagus clarus TaxID=94130 RepID=A0A2Z6RT14_9GLOM|nr:hypothetical protein RclHR1_04180012 [Rhizophagus clarus]GES97825.1 hypothetical protein GLOIN_2v1520007 [Rhizophagus clarus]
MTSQDNSTQQQTIDDIYSHDPDCKYDHPIPDPISLDHIIDSTIDSYPSTITRGIIEKTIHQPLHSLLIPSHKCKSPYAFHHHLNARTLFKRDYINIIHKEILSPKPKSSASPISASATNLSSVASSSSRPPSGRQLNTSTSSNITLDQEINILASLWGESSQEVKQVYEILERCSERIHEYMFKANRLEKEKEENARKKILFETTTSPSQPSYQQDTAIDENQ